MVCGIRFWVQDDMITFLWVGVQPSDDDNDDDDDDDACIILMRR